MMPGFRRSQLRGSDELFRPTQPGDEPAAAGVSRSAQMGAPVEAPTRPEGRLVRLTEDDIAVLSEALQRLKFPTSSRPAVTKPSVAEFEQLEELRQKLLNSR